MYLDLEELIRRKYEESQEEIKSRSDWKEDMSAGEEIGLKIDIYIISIKNNV